MGRKGGIKDFISTRKSHTYETRSKRKTDDDKITNIKPKQRLKRRGRPPKTICSEALEQKIDLINPIANGSMKSMVLREDKEVIVAKVSEEEQVLNNERELHSQNLDKQKELHNQLESNNEEPQIQKPLNKEENLNESFIADFSFNLKDKREIDTTFNSLALSGDNNISKFKDDFTMDQSLKFCEISGSIHYKDSKNFEPPNASFISTEERKLSVPNFRANNFKIPKYINYPPISKPAELPLPYKFEGIYKNFEALFKTMLFNKSQGNRFVFHQIQPVIEGITRRTFDLKQLEQFHFLFGDLFEFEPVKYHDKNSVLIKVPKLGFGVFNIIDADSSKLDYPIDEINKLVKDMRFKLAMLVNESHNKFLLSKGLTTYKDLPFKWHPKFDLESVPDVLGVTISLSSIPIASVAAVKSHPSLMQRVKAKLDGFDLLSKAREMIKASSSEKSSLLSPQAQDSKKEDFEKRTEVALTKQKQLLEKIRQRDNQRKIEQAGTISRTTRQRLGWIQRYPDLICSLKFIFNSGSGKVALPINDVISKIPSNQGYPIELEQKLKYMGEILPEFIKVEFRPLSGKTFVTLIGKDIPSAELQKALDKTYKELNIVEKL